MSWRWLLLGVEVGLAGVGGLRSHFATCPNGEVAPMTGFLDRTDPERGCSGVTATWCPVHGDCPCELSGPAGTRSLNDPGCPLHAPDSPHGFAERLEELMR